MRTTASGSGWFNVSPVLGASLKGRIWGLTLPLTLFSHSPLLMPLSLLEKICSICDNIDRAKCGWCLIKTSYPVRCAKAFTFVLK